jgi:hypothetical protein
MQPEAATRFEAAVLAGAWDDALALLPALLPSSSSSASSSSSTSSSIAATAAFLILRHKYLEALWARDVAGALRVLRGELAPLASGGTTTTTTASGGLVPASEVHALAALLLAPPPPPPPPAPTTPPPPMPAAAGTRRPASGAAAAATARGRAAGAGVGSPTAAAAAAATAANDDNPPAEEERAVRARLQRIERAISDAPTYEAAAQAAKEHPDVIRGAAEDARAAASAALACAPSPAVPLPPLRAPLLPLLPPLAVDVGPGEAAVPSSAPASTTNGNAAAPATTTPTPTTTPTTQTTLGRQCLLAELKALLPPGVLLPDARLDELVERAALTSAAACPCYNPPVRGAALPLLADPRHTLDDLPCQQWPLGELTPPHSDEVWHVAFSHSGKLLASCSRDCTARVWRVVEEAEGGGGSGNEGDNAAPPALPRPELVAVLRGHTGPVLQAAWSPDDRWLLTCGEDAKLRLWDVAALSGLAPAAGASAAPRAARRRQRPRRSTGGSGGGGGGGAAPMDEDDEPPAAAQPPTTTTTTAPARLAHTFPQHRDTVAAATWLPDSRRFFSSGPDRLLLLCDVTGRELGRWRRPLAVQDLAATPDGRHLILACSTDRLLQVVRLAEGGPAGPGGGGAAAAAGGGAGGGPSGGPQSPRAAAAAAGAGSPPPAHHHAPPPPPLGVEVSVQESAPLTALAVSCDGRWLLANLQCHTTHLWPLDPLLPATAREQRDEQARGRWGGAGGGGGGEAPLPPPSSSSPPSAAPSAGGAAAGAAAGSAGGAGVAGVPAPALPSWAQPAVAAGGSAGGAPGSAGGATTTPATATTTTTPPAVRPPRGAGVAAFASASARLGPAAEYVANSGRPGRFVLRACFGGGRDGAGFVAHGGEDAALHLWHRDSGARLLKLDGHTGPVNAVAWNPARPHLLASCSDDRSVRLWVSGAVYRRAMEEKARE